MKFVLPGPRLTLPRIVKRPKPVYAVQFQDFAGAGKNPALQDELNEIIESIERGEGVAEEFYRAGIDQDGDELLRDKGIMHLHLGGKASDILVFLIQYDDCVVLLETNTHVHFRTQPAGANILALHQSWLNNLEHDMAAAKLRNDEERRAEIAASVAAFKRKAGLA